MSATLHLIAIDIFPTDLFNSILCAIENLAMAFLAVIILALNAIIVSIGGLITVVAAVLPTWNPTVQNYDSGTLQWIDYFFPIGTFISLWTTIVTLWLVILGVRIVGKWVKAF